MKETIDRLFTAVSDFLKEPLSAYELIAAAGVLAYFRFLPMPLAGEDIAPVSSFPDLFRHFVLWAYATFHGELLTIFFRILALTANTTAACLVYRIARNIFSKNHCTAVFAGVFFALFPLNAFTVFTISMTGRIISAIFILWATALALENRLSPVKTLVMTAAACAFSISGAILPVIAWLAAEARGTDWKKLFAPAFILSTLAVTAAVIISRYYLPPYNLVTAVPDAVKMLLSTAQAVNSPLFQNIDASPRHIMFAFAFLTGTSLSATLLYRRDRQTFSFIAGFAAIVLAAACAGQLSGVSKAPALEFQLYLLSVPAALLAALGLEFLYTEMHDKNYAIAAVLLASVLVIYCHTSEIRSATDIFAGEEIFWKNVSSSYPAREPLNRYAEQMLQNGKKLEALMMLHKAEGYISSGKEVSKTFLLMANYYATERPEKAASFYEKAMQANPEDITPLINLAAFYEKRGQIQEAEKTYQNAIRLMPDLASLRYRHGMFLLSGNNYNASFEELQKACSLEKSYCNPIIK